MKIKTQKSNNYIIGYFILTFIGLTSSILSERYCPSIDYNAPALSPSNLSSGQNIKVGNVYHYPILSTTLNSNEIAIYGINYTIVICSFTFLQIF